MAASQTEQFANRITARITADREESVKLDPFTIFTIVCGLLNLLMQCWHFWHQGPTTPHEALVMTCRSPARKSKLIRQAAYRYRREARLSHQTEMSKEESYVLARATIEEALLTTPAELNSFATACGLPSPSEQHALLQEDLDDE